MKIGWGSDCEIFGGRYGGGWVQTEALLYKIYSF